VTQIRFSFNGDRLGPVLEKTLGAKASQVRSAARKASADMAADFVRKASDDVAGAGNFGSRWTKGFNTSITEGGGRIKVVVTHQVPYFSVFQYGKVIEGKPLLWLPFSFATDAQGVWPRDFPRPLFRVDRKRDGLPILFAFTPSGRAKRGWPSTARLLGLRVRVSASASTGRGTAEPKYFGKERVTIPQKFQTDAIALEAVADYREFFNLRMKEGNG
jgi:hypothetical protein